MRNSRLVALVGVILGLIIASAHSQDNPHVTTSFPPTTFAEALRAKGVTDFSEESLVAALKSTDPQVRGLAASKLAEDHQSDALLAIETAMFAESVPGTQVNFAQALWVLHDPKGVEQLHSMCTNSSLPMGDLISVWRALQNTRSSSGVCAETLLAAMERSKNSENENGEYLSVAVYMLSYAYADVPADQAGRITTLLEELLLDRKQDNSVRLLSSQALARIGAPESAKVIRQAVSEETDPTLRSGMQSDLDSLAKKPQ